MGIQGDVPGTTTTAGPGPATDPALTTTAGAGPSTDPALTTTGGVCEPDPSATTTAQNSSPAPEPTTTTTSATSPRVDSFTGALKVSDGSVQMPDSLQVVVGSPLILSWKLANAPDGVEFTDPATGTAQKLPATVATAAVTPQQAMQDYALVAINGAARSHPSTVHVSTHAADEAVSPHSGVHLTKDDEAGEGMEYVLGAISEVFWSHEWPEDDPAAHFKLGVSLKADFEVVFKGAEAEKPDLETAKGEVEKSLVDYFEANIEVPLISAIKNPDFKVTAAGMTEAKLLEQSREKGEKSYTFGEVTLLEVQLSVPKLEGGLLTFDLTAAVAEVSFAKPLDSGLGILSGSVGVTIIDASAGIKDIGIGHGLEVKGELSAEFEASFTALTVVDLLRRAGVTVAEDVLVDTGVTFADAAAGVTVDGVVACASVAASVALVIFVGYEVNEAFNELAKADRENDFGIKIKFDNTYVNGVMSGIRDTVNTGAGLGLLGGLVPPIAGEIMVEAGKLGTATRLKMQQALSARNSNLAEDKFETLFTQYMAKNKDAIMGALNQQLTELTELFSWMQLVRDGMPMFLQFDNLDTPPIRSVWAVAWQQIFGDQIDALFIMASDADDWKADSSPMLTGKVAGQDKWKVLQESHAWAISND